MSNADAASPSYGWYGDDLTGATDTLSTIARRGHRAFLFLDVPTPKQFAAAGPLDAIGIAGAARAMSPAQMRAALPPIARLFRELDVSMVHYKCCSTFDSAPETGNLATAIEIFGAEVDNPIVPILGGQPSLGRYCSFSNLFAAAGAQVHRIDRHPTMSRHPSTPMTEADLCRHFEALGMSGVTSLHWPSITAAGLSDAWDVVAAQQPPAILLDVIEQRHIDVVGELLRQAASQQSMLVMGASSVAEAWFGGSPPAQSSPDQGAGPTLALIGSLSPVTRAQVEATTSYVILAARADELAPGSTHRAEIRAAAATALHQGRNVMVSTAPVRGEAPDLALADLAAASAALVDDILTDAPVRRLAIAGGDTSTIAVTALGFWGLEYHGLAARGVAVCRGRHDSPARDGMLLMLKGGQMGHAELFDEFAGAAAAVPASAC